MEAEGKSKPSKEWGGAGAAEQGKAAWGMVGTEHGISQPPGRRAPIQGSFSPCVSPGRQHV